jgi:hypothetical protein
MYARRDQFLVAQVGFMLTAVFLLVLLGLFSYELFFVISLLGLLVVTGFVVPLRVTPVWQRRLRWIVLAGVIGFSYLVIRRILILLPQGVF